MSEKPKDESAQAHRARQAQALGGSGAQAARLLLEAVLLCGLTVLGIAALVPAPKRMPSARPTRNGFAPALEELCAHPGVAARNWRYVVVHHSATEEGGAAAFERYHVTRRGWDSLAYHFVIGNGTQTGDGEIEVGPRWTRQREGSHAGVREYNEHGIGICFVGDFEVQQPTKLQMRSLAALARYLMVRFDIPPDAVLGHRECPGAATKCPGPNLDMEELRDRLR